MFRPLLILMFLTSAALADTWTVDDDGKADFDNIQDAVDASSDGDEIIVMPGTYTGTGAEVVDMLGKALTLRSSDPSDPEVVAATIIDGENTRRGLICNSGEENSTHIQGFTIQNGFSDVGGGGVAILSSSPNFSDCVIKNNNCQNPNQWSGVGGGVYIQGGNDIDASTFMNCTISNNTANLGGGLGVYYSGNYYYLNNCIIQDNLANDGGGIYSNNSHGSMINSTVCGNLPNQIITTVGVVSDEGGNTVAAICPVPGACCTNDGCVVSEEEDCNTFLGQWLGEGSTCQDNPCPNSCFADITGDGVVDVSDLLVIIAVWGACP